MGSCIDTSGLIKNMDFIHFHKNRDPSKLVNTVKHRRLILDQIGDGLGIMQTCLAVLLTDFRKLGIILFQNLPDLLECHHCIVVRLSVGVSDLNTYNNDCQKGNQNECDQIHVLADNFF